MIKKYIGITLITASVAVAGCSSNDDDGIGAITDPIDEVIDGGDGDGGEDGGTDPATPPAVDGSPTVEVPQELSETAAAASAEAGSATDVLTAEAGIENGITGEVFTFGTLAGLIAADPALSEALAGEGPVTIFAPNDNVFEALEAIPEGEELSALLADHVVLGAVDSTFLVGNTGSSIAASSGNLIEITETEGGAAVGGANVAAADVATSNGIIHVVDGLLTTSAPAAETPVAPVDGGDGGDGGGVDGVPSESSLNDVSAAGFTEFAALFAESGLGEALVDPGNEWTVFVPADGFLSALGDVDASVVTFDHILTDFGALDAQGLLDAAAANGGSLPANGGAPLAIGGTADALTVNGFAASVIPPIPNGVSSLIEIQGVIIQ